MAAVGCSSSSHGDSNSVAEPGTASTAPAAVLTRNADALAITKQLAAAVPTVRLDIAFTAATDPNGKLGRPHQYTSKTAFIDSRIPAAKAKEDAADGDHHPIAAGGTVEVFATDADAKAWIAYVDKIGQAFGGMVTPDYLLRHGRYVIRASHLLTPTQVDGYKAVLAKLG